MSVVRDLQKKRSTDILATLWLATLITLSFNSFGASDTLNRFERKLATFDPGGQYLTRPIERYVPGLSVNGSYFYWADSLVSGQDDIGFRKRDYHTVQAQNIFELELNYQLSPGMEITSINHILYDAVYDLENAQGLYADDVDRAFSSYDNAERMVRELYFSYRTLKLDLVLGKQQIAWGKMDGQFIDAINSMDLRESVQLEASDYQIRRLPVWMANATYYFEDVSLNLLWIPDFEENRNPGYGAPWSSPLLPPDDATASASDALLNKHLNFFGDRVLSVEKPDWQKFSDHSFAARVDIVQGALTWGLVYYYAWERDPVQMISGKIGPQLVIQPEHKRIHHFGITSDYAWVIPDAPWIGSLPVVFRAEALYTKGAHFTDFRKMAAARTGPLNDGVSEKDTVRGALAFEFALPANTTAIFQPSFYYTMKWHRGLGSGFGGAIGDRWNFIPVIFVGRPIRATRDRLQLNITLSPYFSGPDRGYQGSKAKFVASYEFSQYIKGSFIVTDYSGGNDDDLFGQYRKWDNVGIELQYEF